jgi:hypothetical protein
LGLCLSSASPPHGDSEAPHEDMQEHMRLLAGRHGRARACSRGCAHRPRAEGERAKTAVGGEAPGPTMVSDGDDQGGATVELG